MSTGIHADPSLIESFSLMWGAYPCPASLVHKSKTIIAANEACRKGGREPGMICAQWSSPDNHRGCLANRVLKERIPLYKEVRRPDGVFRVYWLPLPDFPDFYVHFTTDVIRFEPDALVEHTDKPGVHPKSNSEC